MTQAYDTLALQETTDSVLVVTLDRPEFSNAFNTQMALDLTDFFEGNALEPNRYRVIIITGQGEKAFCAGGDLKERNGMSDEDWFRQHLVYEKMIRAVIACPVPLIGAINGAAYGGGCELVAALDFSYAAVHARFAQTETRIGIIPGIGGTQNLARAIGERRAKEYILSGKPFSAEQACEWGLINAVYPTVAALHEAVMNVASDIARNAPSGRQNLPYTRGSKCLWPRVWLLRLKPTIGWYRQMTVVKVFWHLTRNVHRCLPESRRKARGNKVTGPQLFLSGLNYNPAL